jgi:hypothetical protein
MGERRRRLDHVLAVVQDQQDLAFADGGDEPFHRFRVRCVPEQGVPQAECGERRLGHVALRADGRELHQPRPVRQVVQQRAHGFRRQPGLSRSAGTDQGGEPMSRDEVADRGYVGVLADVAGQLGAQVGPAALLPATDLTAQQRDVQGGQLRRGVDTQFVGQSFSGTLERQQRFAVAPGFDQGTHQGHDELFPHRIRGHQIGQLADQVRTTAKADLGVEPVLHGGQAQFFEPGGRGVQCFAVLQTDVLQGWAAPQRESVS